MALSSSFYFPSNNGGEVKGISDSGMETFNGNTIKGLGREILQNSLDANKNYAEPAIVEFSLFEIPFSELPGSASLQDSFKRARQYWDKQKSKKAKTFFNQALNNTEGLIPILRISDFNTTGLTGAKAEYNTPWINLTKSSGVSDKENGTMGSFGIGKFATFAASSLRTVFYNTVDKENEVAFQGIARLTSFIDKNSETTQGAGYIGGELSKPEYANLSLDPNFQRNSTETGTDIYVVGFKNVENSWKEEIISAVLDGFLYAIHAGNLIVKVGDTEINKNTLPEIINEYSDYFSEGANFYYKVLTSPNSKYYEKEYRNHGKIKLWILLDDEMNNKTAIIRGAGMKIKDYPFPNSLLIGSAVMIIEGEKIQQTIVPLENPAHTDWEVKRAEENRPYLRSYIKGIYDIIKEKLSDLAGIDDLDEMDSGVGEYLPLISSDENSTTNEEAISNEVKTIIKREAHTPKSLPDEIIEINPPNDNFGVEDDESGEIIGSGNSGHKKSDNPIQNPENPRTDTSGDGYGTATKPSVPSIHTVSVSNLRILAQDKRIGRYVIAFTPNESVSNSTLKITLVGETRRELVEVKEAMTIPPKSLTISKNTISGLNLIKGKLARVIVTIDFDDYVAMEVNISGN
jgi:hypothetical protein